MVNVVIEPLGSKLSLVHRATLSIKVVELLLYDLQAEKGTDHIV